jgi:hypothetical protein
MERRFPKMNNLDLLMEMTTKIESGEFDKQLHIMKTSLEKRIEEIRGSVSADDFLVDEKIRINEKCGTRYLIGQTGVVVGKRRTKITIRLDNPVGRFKRTTANGDIISAEVVVPTELVDRI